MPRVMVMPNDDILEDDLWDMELEQDFLRYEPTDFEENIENNESDIFSYLNKFLSNESNLTKINTAIQVHPIDIVMMILKFSFIHSIPLSAVVDLFKMFNYCFTVPILPQSRYFIDKLFNPKNGATYHAVCNDCGTYVGSYEKNDNRQVNCPFCQSIIDLKNIDQQHFFITINPSHAIRNLLQKHWKYYNWMTNERVPDNNVIKCFSDGKLSREFVKQLDPETRKQYATYTFNADGARVFKKGGKSMWLIQLIINEIPENEKLMSPILTGIWYGDKKPDMNVFLTPFIEQMNSLADTGVKCYIAGEQKIVKLFGLCCCVDSGARGPIQGLTQYNGKFGCNWCLHPGKWTREHSQVYPNKNPPYQKRSHEESVRNIESAVNLRKDNPKITVNGFKNASQLLLLDFFDIITGLVPDYMHACALGIARQFMDIWFSTNNIECKLRDHESEIDKKLACMKAPRKVARLSRPLSSRTNWNAREYENWILYYSVPILRSYFSEKYLHHWMKFVEALFILLQSEITLDELDKAHQLMLSFVELTEKLYGEGAMSPNVHQMIHISDSVRNWGPLWCHSGYPFESGNGVVLKHIYAANGVHEQIKRYVLMDLSYQNIESKVTETNCIAQYYCNEISSRCCVKSVKYSEPRYFGLGKPVNHLDIMYPLSSYAKSYDRVVFNDCLYSSCKINCKKSNNSYAQLSDRIYVQIQEFIADEATGTELAIIKEVYTDFAFENSCKFLKIMTLISNEFQAIPIQMIKKPCALIECDGYQYICSVPNILSY